MNAEMRQSIKRKQATIEMRDRIAVLEEKLKSIVPGSDQTWKLERQRHEIKLQIDAIRREYR